MDRQQQILALTQKVEMMASMAMRRVQSSVGREDLVSEAWIGAIHAVDRWNPRRASLSTFADKHIRGAMLDYMRRLDPCKREARDRHKAAVVAAIAAEQLPPPPPVHVVELDALRWTPDELSEGIFRRTEACADLVTIMDAARLSPRYRAVIERHDLDGENLRVIGRSMGVNESRASQMRTAALRKLRAAA